MATGGRKPILDDGKQREICAIVAVGGTRQLAAHYVGCAPDTIRKTADRDAAFAEALARAESQHEIIYLQRIQTAASKEQYWRAAAWALERRYPERYAARKPQIITLDQFMQLMTEFAELVAVEVSDQRSRKRLLGRLQTLWESAAVEPPTDAEIGEEAEPLEPVENEEDS